MTLNSFPCTPQGHKRLCLCVGAATWLSIVLMLGCSSSDDPITAYSLRSAAFEGLEQSNIQLPDTLEAYLEHSENQNPSYIRALPTDSDDQALERALLESADADFSKQKEVAQESIYFFEYMDFVRQLITFGLDKMVVTACGDSLEDAKSCTVNSIDGDDEDEKVAFVIDRSFLTTALNLVRQTQLPANASMYSRLQDKEEALNLWLNVIDPVDFKMHALPQTGFHFTAEVEPPAVLYAANINSPGEREAARVSWTEKSAESTDGQASFLIQLQAPDQFGNVIIGWTRKDDVIRSSLVFADSTSYNAQDQNAQDYVETQRAESQMFVEQSDNALRVQLERRVSYTLSEASSAIALGRAQMKELDQRLVWVADAENTAIGLWSRATYDENFPAKTLGSGDEVKSFHKIGVRTHTFMDLDGVLSQTYCIEYMDDESQSCEPIGNVQWSVFHAQKQSAVDVHRLDSMIENPLFPSFEVGVQATNLKLTGEGRSYYLFLDYPQNSQWNYLACNATQTSFTAVNDYYPMSLYCYLSKPLLQQNDKHISLYRSVSLPNNSAIAGQEKVENLVIQFGD